ncbi:DNA/RNA helicase, partial [Pseudomonadota bacterium]
LPAGYDGAAFFTSVAQVSKVYKSANGYLLSSGSDDDTKLVLSAGIFKKVIPTNLDRKRMDMIMEGGHQVEGLYSALGKQMVRLRGHGGTGKTIMCLQAAWKLYEETGARTLVLTYNLALAADIRRLLVLLNVPSDPELGGIKVDTVMSFMYSWFRRLQLLEDDEDLSFDNYDAHCANATAMLKGGAITGGDVDAIKAGDQFRYDFNSIVVDEAQDWPQEEASLLKALYEPNTICLADGVDQLIRGKATNWDEGVPREARKIIPLQKCLRMKRNLSVFVNKLAGVGKVNWNIEPNNSAGGGTIKILLRPYQDYQGLHQELLASAMTMGNAELDFLFCVPPSSVNSQGDKKESDIAIFLKGLGAAVWDGVDPVTRKNFPRGTNEFRIVQYESCRGLEGWTVILNKPDVYWESCKNDKLKTGMNDAERLALEDIGELAIVSAWRRTLISLTRPLDTLVISLDDPESEFSSTLLDVARECSEFIEILE